MHPDASNADAPPAADPTPAARRHRPFRLRLRWRPESGELHVRLGRATAAAVAVALLCTTLASLGRLVGPRGEPLDELSVASAIDPFNPAETPPGSSPLIRLEEPARVPADRPRATPPRATPPRATPPAAAAASKVMLPTVRRTVGLNYLVLGTVASRRDAERRRNELARQGIVVTVEPALSGWSRGGYSLVGVHGFDLERDDAALDRQRTRLRALKIDAYPYKWRPDAVASTS